MITARLAKLNKLRTMSLGEVIGRSQQEFNKLADRLIVPHKGEMSDQVFVEKLDRRARGSAAVGAAAALLGRLSDEGGAFMPGLRDRESAVNVLKTRFPEDCRQIVSTADRAMAGRFDLLGYHDLDFGYPIDWRLDPRTGDRAPLIHWSRIDSVAPIGRGDLKVYWEISRTAHFVSLGQAYWLTGDERYAEEFVRQAISWIDANPAGMGVGWAASLDVSFRAISWLWALAMCATSPKLTPEATLRILKSLVEHGEHIEKYLSHYFSPNTHLTGEALGLFYLGLGLPELRAADGWRATGLRILLEQLPIHVQDDGVYFEQSSYYHRYTADFYTHLLLLIEANGIGLAPGEDKLLRGRLRALYDHLLWIGRPDGTWPFFGDDDGGRLISLAPQAPNDFSDTMAAGVAIFGGAELKSAARRATSNLVWLMGSEGLAAYDRVEAASPTALSRSFDAGGYVVMRDGWESDSSYLLFDCGRHGSEPGFGHAHSDALSIELALRGTTWLVDPGTFVYGAEPQMRDYFRSTAAHNTVSVDGESQSVPAGPFSWSAIASCRMEAVSDDGGRCICTGSHDGFGRFEDPVIHRRSVLMLRKKEAVFLSDRFEAAGRHTYTLRFHFAEGCVVCPGADLIEARNGRGEALELRFFVNGDALTLPVTRVEEGWVSTCYGRRAATPVAVFEVLGEGPIEITTLILPGAEFGNR